MGLFDHFPYTNFHELNLDWIIKKVREMDSKLDAYLDRITIHYSDPIDWDITKQYAQNTVVKDPDTAQLYLSKQPVPVGIPLTNEDYWLKVGDIDLYGEWLASLDSRTINQGIMLGQTREDLDEEITNRENADTALDGQIDAVSDRIDALEPLIRYPALQFTGGKALCFGDSNAEESSTSQYPGRGNIFQRLRPRLKITNWENYGVSGACFQAGVGSYAQILSQITPLASDETVNFVLLIGGINDFHYATYDQSAFSSAVRQTIDAIVSKFPNALVVTMFDANYRLPNNRKILYEVSMERVCSTYSGGRVIYVSVMDFCLRGKGDNGLYESPNHYNVAGANAAASRIVSTLMGQGPGFIPLPMKTTHTYTSGAPETDSGAYNFTTETYTYIDPVNLVRRDEHHIHFLPDFTIPNGYGSEENVLIMTHMPGTSEFGNRYWPAYTYAAGGTSGEVQMVAMGITNRYTLNATDEPELNVHPITHYEPGASVFGGRHAYMDFTTCINGVSNT